MRNTLLGERARSLRNAATDAERRLWKCLRQRQVFGFRFRRQVPIADFIADFACIEARLVIELDGGQHQQSMDYDARRDEAIRACGYRVLRFWNNDVLCRTESVVEMIAGALRNPHPDPPPATGGGK